MEFIGATQTFYATDPTIVKFNIKLNKFKQSFQIQSGGDKPKYIKGGINTELKWFIPFQKIHPRPLEWLKGDIWILLLYTLFDK